MRAFITSIGEPTTELCRWSLERQGFDVTVIQNESSFNAKLKEIYNLAEDDFVRVDADVIANRNVQKLVSDCPEDVWWWQSMSFDWWQMDICYAGVQFIKKECIPILRANIERAMHIDRPESFMYRLEEFHNPRRCHASTLVCGIHGFKQDNMERVKEVKIARNQIDKYDFELAERILEL